MLNKNPIFAWSMRRLFLILVSLCLVCSLLSAQSAQKADELFSAQQYNDALKQYEALLRVSPQQQLYQYRYARCLQETGRKEEAVRWFEVAGERYLLRNFYLAGLYNDTYRFDAAVMTIEKYLAAIDSTSERFEAANTILREARKGARFIKRVDDIVITDSIILPKKRFLEAYDLSSECGILEADTNGVNYTNARGDRRLLSKDGRLLTCERFLDNWSQCDTLPEPLNGDFSSDYPYMLSDGITMYFASDDAAGMGGYDIFKTRYNTATKTWLTPENIGFPFNSRRNDYMLAIDEQRGVGFFATDRRTADDSVTVYRFLLNEEKTILRDTTEEYVRKAAQLLVYGRALNAESKTEYQAEQSSSHKADTAEATQRIIINDSIIYKSLQEFRSDEARHLAAEYADLLKRIEEECLSLEENRRLFSQASDDTQKSSLRAIILTQEKTLRLFSADSHRLLKVLRREELNSLNPEELKPVTTE